MKLLVTVVAGSFGSHTCNELLRADFEPVVVDSLSNSKPEALRRVERVGGCGLPFYQADIRDKRALLEVFSQHEIEAVIHFAGLKAVGESGVSRSRSPCCIMTTTSLGR